jgi:L-fuculose-phosphate aldolase
VLENHGVVTGGATLGEAFERFETLEFCAKTVIKASQLGTVRYLNEADSERPRPLVTAGALTHQGPPPSDEKELRRQLAEFVRRSYRQRLMISTQGAFSARVDEDSFLITPHRVDRSTLEIPDIVLVRQGATEPGKTPSSSAVNHRAIYDAQPKVRAIVGAYPVNASAFSVVDAPFDARTIPESYIFLREVSRAPYGVQFGDGRELSTIVSLRHPVLILENDGVLVCGTSVLDAFDRLEVLESTAEAMIGALAFHDGPIVPMSDNAIAELRTAFNMD